MKIRSGTYFDREGRKVEIVGVSDGWAYAVDGVAYQWFYADTGQSAMKFSHWKWFPCSYDLIERLAQ